MVTASWTTRAILHVDMDAFFASVEQLDNPAWRGVPVIVGGSPDGRGVVSAASYEARRCGVRSAMPSVRARQLCPEAVWARPRFARYQEVSRAVMEILASCSPRVEQVSVDEAYVDVTPGRFDGRDPAEIAREIQARVDVMGVTCSIGVATSKSVAKIASDYDKPRGMVVVSPGTEAAFLAPLPVSSLQGIGPMTARRLESAGVHTLGQLGVLDERSALDLLGRQGPGLVLRARGIDDREVKGGDGRKSISNEHTFSEDIRDQADIDEVVRRLSAKVASRLRKTGLVARTVTVKVRFGDFSTRTAQRTHAGHVCTDEELFDLSRELVREIWSPGVGLRLLGVGVSGLEVEGEQLSFCDDSPSSAHDRPHRLELLRSLDSVRERFGEDAISQGLRDSARRR